MHEFIKIGLLCIQTGLLLAQRKGFTAYGITEFDHHKFINPLAQ